MQQGFHLAYLVTCGSHWLSRNFEEGGGQATETAARRHGHGDLQRDMGKAKGVYRERLLPYALRSAVPESGSAEPDRTALSVRRLQDRQGW